MVCAIEAIAAWLVITLVASNLLGFAMHAIFLHPPPFDPSTDAGKAVAREAKRIQFFRALVVVVALVAIAAFFYALAHYWNVGVALIAALPMAARFPDYIWEIRHGERMTKANMPKGPTLILTNLVLWGSLPLLWYFMCR